MRVFRYLRVSTTDQDTAAQLQIVQAYTDRAAPAAAIIVDLQDSKSGTVAWQERAIAGAIASADAGDWLIVSELSRIGRSTADVLDFLAAAARAGLAVHLARGGTVLDSSITGKMLATMLALMAELERDMLSARTKEGLAAAVQSGKKLGRPTGPAKRHKLDRCKGEIMRLIGAGVSVPATARLLGTSTATLRRYMLREEITQ